MQPLDDVHRRRLLFYSGIFCALPLCLAPLAARSSIEIAGERAAMSHRFPVPALDTAEHDGLTVARDPFRSAPQAGPKLAGSSVVGMRVVQGRPIGFTVPAGTPAVSAIVTGPKARALLDDGVQVRVVGVGDLIGGVRITAIDEAGVHLENGLVLRAAQSRS